MEVRAGYKTCEVQCLYARDEVEQALDKMARDISAELAGTDPLLLCVMQGGVAVFGQLLTRLEFPLQIEYLHVTRYGASTTAGDLQWKVRPETALKNRVVLIVDDILDEGGTLAAIMDYCRESGASAIYTGVLVEKVHTRKCAPGFRADFTGLQAEDRFLVGFGMDYQGYLRNLPGIFAVESVSQTVESKSGSNLGAGQEHEEGCRKKA